MSRDYASRLLLYLDYLPASEVTYGTVGTWYCSSRWWAQGGGTIETKGRAEPACIASARFGPKARFACIPVQCMHYTALYPTSWQPCGHAVPRYAMPCSQFLSEVQYVMYFAPCTAALYRNAMRCDAMRCLPYLTLPSYLTYHTLCMCDADGRCKATFIRLDGKL